MPRSASGRLLGWGVALATLVVVIPWLRAPLSFDEAYNLQVVRNLVEGHGYATDGALYGGHRVLFDYQITTGPTLLLPVAAVVAVLGQHVWVYRLVPIVVTCLTVWAWFALVRRSQGAVAGGVAAASFLMLDNAAYLHIARFGPGTVIGETLSVLFLLLAAMTLRRPALSGLLAGLAVMTKVITLLAVPGIALGILVAASRASRGRTSAFFRFLVALVVPAACWQLYRIWQVGLGGNSRADHDYLSFLTSSGGGGLPLSHLPTRAAEQLAVLGGAGTVAFLVALVLVVRRGGRPGLLAVGSWPAEVLAVLVAGVVLELWWLALEEQGWVRHSTQATELLVPLLAAAIPRALASTERPPVRRVLSVALPSLVVVQIGVAVYHGWSPPGPSLADQRAVAREASSRGGAFVFPDEPQAFELTLLAPVHAQPFEPGDAGRVMVLSGLHGQQSTSPCESILYRRGDYVVCRAAPTAMPPELTTTASG
jgi:hypothetical protein